MNVLEFKHGQLVVVLQAYVGGSSASGTIVKPGEGKEYEGKWWVDLGFTILPVEPERIVDAAEHWARERAKYAHPPNK